MKRFHRVLAMLLAMVTVLSVMPLSVFADSYVDTTVENTTNEETTTTNTHVVLELDPELLLSYIKSGDKEALLSGISLDGLKDAMTREELFEIFPKKALETIVNQIIEEVGFDTLMQYIKIDDVIGKVDTGKLVEEIQKIGDLTSYILPGGEAILGSYLESADIDLSTVLTYINVKAMLQTHSETLVELALDLEAS